MELTLECQTRPTGSKPKALRRSGSLPVVLYGHDGANSVSLTTNTKDVEMLLRKAAVNSTLIKVNIPDMPWQGQALIREVQSHPWKRTPYHISLFAVGTQDSLEVDIPLHLTGESIGVKRDGGLLDVVLTSLHVKCAPDAIPDAIEVDISALEVGAALHVHELPLPQGVLPTGEADRVVVSVLAGKGGDNE